MARSKDRTPVAAVAPDPVASASASGLETQNLEPQSENRRVTLPPNYDPDGVDELQRLLDCGEEELRKIPAQTLRAGIAQAGTAIQEWRLAFDSLMKERDTVITQKDAIIDFLRDNPTGGGSARKLSARHPDPTPLKDNTDPKFKH
jgi:hypothetical protein